MNRFCHFFRILMLGNCLYGIFFLCNISQAETTWYPDTCNGCAVVYDVDPADPQHSVIFKRIEKVDPPHMAKNPKAQFDAILEENQRKNKAIKSLMDAEPSITKTDENGNIVLKDDVKIDFSYDANRVLHLKLKGPSVNASPKNKAGFKNKLDADLGAGKVEID